MIPQTNFKMCESSSVVQSGSSLKSSLAVVTIDYDYDYFNRNAPSANGWSTRGSCEQAHRETTVIGKGRGEFNYQL